MANHFIIIFIFIKKDWQYKAGRSRLTPYQSEDPRPTLPTYRAREEKGKKYLKTKKERATGQQKGIGPSLKTRESHTICGVTKTNLCLKPSHRIQLALEKFVTFSTVNCLTFLYSGHEADLPPYSVMDVIPISTHVHWGSGQAYNRLLHKVKVFYGQEPPSGESTTTECGFNYQLLAVIY